jgi:6,7-dimethyl-8-ribityllumazine synthase
MSQMPPPNTPDHSPLTTHHARCFEGQLDQPRGRFAIVAARFNGVVTAKLVEGARTKLSECGVAERDVDLIWVPGSLEIPVVAQRLASSGQYAAVVCLGCVIRGDTGHYRHVAGEAARGVAEAARSSGVPVIFGILTTDTAEQALQRCGSTHHAGTEAAASAIRMANLMAQLARPGQSVE